MQNICQKLRQQMSSFNSVPLALSSVTSPVLSGSSSVKAKTVSGGRSLEKPIGSERGENDSLHKVSLTDSSMIKTSLGEIHVQKTDFYALKNPRIIALQTVSHPHSLL